MDTNRRLSASLEREQTLPINQFSAWETFKRYIPRFLVTMFVDIVIPLVLFFTLQNTIKPVYALMVAGALPFSMVIVKAILSRTFDALGFIVCIGFIISAIVGIVTQDPITLLFGQSLVTGVICSIFTITLIPFHRCQHRFRFYPLAYYLYQDLAPTKRAQIGLPDSLFCREQDPKSGSGRLMRKYSDKQEIGQVYEWIYSNCASFRRSCYEITSIWSVGLFFGCLGQLILILIHLSLNTIVIYGHVILTSITILCIILTIIRVKKERKQTILFIEEWKKNKFQCTINRHRIE